MDNNEIFAGALALASVAHMSQLRKDNVTPYIYHPMAVTRLVKDMGYDLRYQTVAILHDVLEDTDTDESEIEVFGEDILEAVKLLTRPVGADEEKYVTNILKNPMASAVKNADKICNLWDAVCWGTPGEKRSKQARKFLETYIEKAEKYYRGKDVKDKTGYGLGLYLVKWYMEKMGGGMEYYNDNGFVVELMVKKT